MNGIVLSDSLIMMYIFWELVGLSSFLLIGFWFEEARPPLAANKAFLTNRVGDIGMFIGIMILYFNISSFNRPNKNLFRYSQLKKMRNDLELAAFKIYPKLNSLKKFSEKLSNVEFVRMTGSGSAMIAY